MMYIFVLVCFVCSVRVGVNISLSCVCLLEFMCINLLHLHLLPVRDVDVVYMNIVEML